MTRRISTAVLRFALRIFFRRVEVAGLERVPRDGALMFVLNHPNALVDPAFLLCYAPRPVSFLAKSTLFKTPIRLFVPRPRRIRLPQQDAAKTVQNRETFRRVHQLLTSGAPRLAPIVRNKPSSDRSSGASPSRSRRLDRPRGGRSTCASSPRLTTPQRPPSARGAAHFGEPIKVPSVALDDSGEPPREAVRELSDRIARGLRDATLNADHHEALQTVARAERIFSSADDAAPEGERSLADELSLRRRFVEGYAFHRTQSPERLAALEARIRRYEEELEQAGLDAEDFSPRRSRSTPAVGHLITRVALFLALSAPALVGARAYPAYRLAGFFAKKFSRDYDDMVSTIKVISALLLFPLTWLALSALAFALVGWKTALAAFLLAPLTGFIAVRFSEKLDRFIAGTRAVLFFITERRFFRQLLTERRAIRREILALGDEAARSGALETIV